MKTTMKKMIIGLLTAMTAACLWTACGDTIGGGVKTEDLGPGSSVGSESTGGDSGNNSDGGTVEKEFPALGAPSAVYFNETELVLSWNADENAKSGWAVTLKCGGQVCALAFFREIIFQY